MRHLTIYIFGLLLTISSGQVFGQSDTTKSKQILKEINDEDRAHFIFSSGLSYQRQLLGEVGLIYGYSASDGPCNSGGLVGLKLASEFNFNKDNFFIAPKLGVEMDFLIFGARINFIDYTNFTYHDLKFTPEIGLSLTGFLNLFYGYNFSLTDKQIDNVGTHRVTLTINFDKILFGNISRL